MKENVLIDKSIAFASRIIKLHQYLIKTKNGDFERFLRFFDSKAFRNFADAFPPGGRWHAKRAGRSPRYFEI